MYESRGVGTATGYGKDIPGIEFRWGRRFPQPFRPPLRPKNQGVEPRLKNVYSYTSTPPLGLHGMLKGELLPLNFAFNLTLQDDYSGNKLIRPIKMTANW